MWSPNFFLPPHGPDWLVQATLHLFRRMLQPRGTRDLLLVEQPDGVEHERARFGADQPLALQRAMDGAGAKRGTLGDLLDRAEPFRTKPDFVRYQPSRVSTVKPASFAVARSERYPLVA